MNNSIKILSELVAINSIFPNEKKLGEYLEKALIERGFKTKRIYISEDRFNVVGERGTKGKPLVFYGHMDTVPVYGNWTNSPFKLVEKGDKVVVVAGRPVGSRINILEVKTVS
jgi:acetylornithine deacetylase/succinyl-diaminopimelate desuccinylase-like protein